MLVCSGIEVFPNLGGGNRWEATRNRLGGKLQGIILEGSRGFSSWIWFEDLSFSCLLEGVEACWREERVGRFVKCWEDEGRKFRMERRANEAGRFILCSVLDLEAKRFYLVFLEEKGILGG